MSTTAQRQAVGERAQATPVLELTGGSVSYAAGAPLTVADVSFGLYPGEILGLVGESGCGKSTTARALLGLVPLVAGQIKLRGEAMSGRDPRLRAAVQAIFQNPAASFNPKRSLLDSVSEPLRVRGVRDRGDRRRRALAELDRVGITAATAERRPQEVSGGQCQRAAIARATVVRPAALICDEPVSALDVSIQAQILELLAELRAEHGLAMLFISHDLSVVAALCDRTAVMYGGRMVETGGAVRIADDPRHPYSVILTDSAPELTVTDRRPPRLLPLQPAEEIDVRALPGCPYVPYCPRADELCAGMPALAGLPGLPEGNLVACHHPYRPETPAGAASFADRPGDTRVEPLGGVAGGPALEQ